MDPVGFGVGHSCTDNQLPLWREVALGDVAVDGVELDQLGDRPSPDPFGLGQQLDRFQTRSADITNRSPPAPLGCRCFRQRHTENTTQGV